MWYDIIQHNMILYNSVNTPWYYINTPYYISLDSWKKFGVNKQLNLLKVVNVLLENKYSSIALEIYISRDVIWYIRHEVTYPIQLNMICDMIYDTIQYDSVW